jgi:hypothetical protein
VANAGECEVGNGETGVSNPGNQLDQVDWALERRVHEQATKRGPREMLRNEWGRGEGTAGESGWPTDMQRVSMATSSHPEGGMGEVWEPVGGRCTWKIPGDVHMHKVERVQSGADVNCFLLVRERRPRYRNERGMENGSQN